MEKGTEETLLQWHPAFYAGIRIEFREEAEKLVFENEHQLGTKPKEIDVLIIKKNSSDRIRKNIGRIFRKHNILEYKSPDDYFSVDDFYKTYGYACFYKSNVSGVDEIKAEDVTISFVCRNYPRKVMRHLERMWHLRLEKQESGIYYICGDVFGMQFIVTSELEEDNLWLKNLTNDLSERETAEKLLKEYGKHKKDELYRSVMDIIVRANREKFEEVRSMCDALMELMKDELDERERIGERRGERRGEKRGEMKSLVETCMEFGVSRENIINKLIRKFGLTKEVAEKVYGKYAE